MRLKFAPLSCVNNSHTSGLRHDSSRPPVPLGVAEHCWGNSHQRSLDALPSASEPPKTYAKAPSPPPSSSRRWCCAPPERGGPPHPASATQFFYGVASLRGKKNVGVARAEHTATPRTQRGVRFQPHGRKRTATTACCDLDGELSSAVWPRVRTPTPSLLPALRACRTYFVRYFAPVHLPFRNPPGAAERNRR